MSDLEKCVRILNDQPSTRIPGILQIMSAYINALNRTETLEAIQECESALHDPTAKRYTDLDEMWKDLASDEV